MANVDQLQAQVDILEGKVKQLSDMLALFGVNGLNDAFDGSGNQTFGGGLLRLDRNGIEVNTQGVATPTVYWLNGFSSSPSSVYPRSDMSARSTASRADLTTQSATSTTAFARVLTSDTAATTEVTLTADNASENSASLSVQSTAASGYYTRLVGPLLLDNVTADYTTLADGEIWYRSDTDKFKARINGATENLATESYVAANAGVAVKTEQMITPWSWCSLGVQMAALASSAPVSLAYPTANLAIYVPFTLDESTTFTKAFWHNGSTSSGNVDIGIYNEAGTAQVRMGSTAQGTVSVMQEVNIADTTLAAGRYYMAFSCDNTTATFLRGAAGSTAEISKGLGLATQGTAFVLPATATFATPSTSYVPFFGFSIRTLVV